MILLKSIKIALFNTVSGNAMWTKKQKVQRPRRAQQAEALLGTGADGPELCYTRCPADPC